MPFEFVKYQGTGNDFVLIDHRTKFFNKEDAKLIAHICDRRFGIGADGLILLEDHPEADFEMVYFNSDGNQDLIVANYPDNNIIVFQGNGKGNLTEVGEYSVGENPTGIAAADINGDGNLDLVIANHETSYITLMITCHGW